MDLLRRISEQVLYLHRQKFAPTGPVGLTICLLKQKAWNFSNLLIYIVLYFNLDKIQIMRLAKN